MIDPERKRGRGYGGDPPHMQGSTVLSKVLTGISMIAIFAFQ
jgi:hypothetical protein